MNRCARHTPSPVGYLDWHNWAEMKSKTHHQVRCPNCGLFAIWTKNFGRDSSAPTGMEQSTHGRMMAKPESEARVPTTEGRAIAGDRHPEEGSQVQLLPRLPKLQGATGVLRWSFAKQERVTGSAGGLNRQH